MSLPEHVIKFFWNHVEITYIPHTKLVDVSACWNWTGFIHHRNGTPIIQKVVDDRLTEFQPRRISMELANKPISSRVQIGFCQNKMCVNPSHLVTGDEARFWNKVMKPSWTDCWLWTGGDDKNGYGKFSIRINGESIDIRAHRYSWMLANNIKIKSKLLFVCHTCDYPRCVNPDHLFLGEVQDNVDDMVKKGRQAQGEKSPFAKLTEAEVIQIRKLHSTGNYSYVKLANQFNVEWRAIKSAVTYDTWKNVI